MAHLLCQRTLKTSVARASIAQLNCRATGIASIHSGLIQRAEEESKKESTTTTDGGESAVPPAQSLASRLGLTDWKVTAPIGIAIAIPTLSNGIYVMNEESQLAACFFLFCTSVYKFGGDMIASFFDAKSKAILKEHNAIENATIAMAKETLLTHTQQTQIVDDLTCVQEAHKEVVKLMCQVESHKLRHQMRNVFKKNLDSIVAYEKDYMSRMQSNMVEYATNSVRSVVSEGGKNIKGDAFKNALSVLSQEESADDKEDDIAKLFCTNLKEYAQNLESQTGKVVQLSSAEISDLQTELDMYMKRHDMEAVGLEAPSEVTLELIK